MARGIFEDTASDSIEIDLGVLQEEAKDMFYVINYSAILLYADDYFN